MGEKAAEVDEALTNLIDGKFLDTDYLSLYFKDHLPAEDVQRGWQILMNANSKYEDFQLFRQSCPLSWKILMVLRSGKRPDGLETLSYEGPRALERLIAVSGDRFSLTECIDCCLNPAFISHLGRFLLFFKGIKDSALSLSELFNQYVLQTPTVELYRAMAISDEDQEFILTKGFISPLRYYFIHNPPVSDAHRNVVFEIGIEKTPQEMMSSHVTTGTRYSNLISFSYTSPMAKYASRYSLSKQIKDNPSAHTILFRVKAREGYLIKANGLQLHPNTGTGSAPSKEGYVSADGEERYLASSHKVESWMEFSTPPGTEIEVVESGFPVGDLEASFSLVDNVWKSEP